MKNSSHPNVIRNAKFQLIQLLIQQCYYENLTHSSILPYNQTAGPAVEKWCPRTFDGFSCWDATPAGAVAFQNCPGFVVGFDSKRLAYKRCMEDASWFTHPDGLKPWTNYTACVDVDDLEFRSTVNNIYVIGYSLSVAALSVSLMIFTYFRSLQCTRIWIHMHLFTAFALNNVLWIVWYKTVVNTVSVLQENTNWCQAVHILTNYFMVASYLWMFCEGLHLHIALVVVFVKVQLAMRWFATLGWGLPLLIVSAYAASRFHSGATERCWTDESDSFLIIIIPVVVSLMASFVFLINVVRVLLTKLNPQPNQYPALAAKKAAKAALILIPLFGLQFVIIPLRPAPDSPWEKTYQVVAALLTSFQGLWVSVIFTFTNHEVMVATRTLLSKFLKTTEAIPMTGVTGGESVMNVRENMV